MTRIAQYQLQSVLARRHVQRHLGLAAAEMDVVVVSGQAVGQFIRTIFTLPDRWTVNQQMVMARIFPSRFRLGPRPYH